MPAPGIIFIYLFFFLHFDIRCKDSGTISGLQFDHQHSAVVCFEFSALMGIVQSEFCLDSCHRQTERHTDVYATDPGLVCFF